MVKDRRQGMFNMFAMQVAVWREIRGRLNLLH